jgi:hypothetical protein
MSKPFAPIAPNLFAEIPRADLPDVDLSPAPQQICWRLTVPV